MNNNFIREPSNAQKKYREKQSNSGYVRFELQVKAQAKQRFEAMVEAKADEYLEPFDKKRRMARARRKIFDQITQGISETFTGLKNEIHRLKQEVAALSPSFFKTDISDSTPLPSAISALPDDPQALKKILSKTYREAQQAKLDRNEYKRRADQYLELYELCQDEVAMLKDKMESCP